jgi:hypothetical protein
LTDTWQLLRNGQVVAELVVSGGDWPWLHADFEPKAGFEEIRPLFAADAALIEGIDDEGGVEAWEVAYNRIREAVSLAAPDGHLVAEFILHIDDDGARSRWTDEPFDGPQP